MKTLLTVICALALFLPHADAEQMLVLGNTTIPPLSNPQHSGMLDQIAEEAFGRIGRKVRIETFPAERSLMNANEGITDGELIRLGGISRMYPNLIAVPEKLNDVEFVAFSKNPLIRLNGWESLKPFHVGFIRGWKILENNVKDRASLTRVSTPELLFTLLEKNRADLVIYHRIQGYGMLHRMGLKNIIALEPPLEKKETFMYLHQKHRELVAPLAAALQEMKKDGSYGRIMRETVEPFLPKENR